VVVARETIELAFLAAIQHLPSRQRAVLILRDVLGFSAKDTASMLEASVPSVNSALQRARATLRDQLPEQRTEWARSTEPSQEERELLRRYVEAHERADADALAELLRQDARLTMPPIPTWYAGREAILISLSPSSVTERAVASGRAGWFSDDGELTQILPVDQRPDRHRSVSLAVIRGSPA
jgi:RNA polymerase sigma-70 factor, ECF subfamily